MKRYPKKSAGVLRDLFVKHVPGHDSNQQNGAAPQIPVNGTHDTEEAQPKVEEPTTDKADKLSPLHTTVPQTEVKDVSQIDVHEVSPTSSNGHVVEVNGHA